MKLVIFGASGGTGKALVTVALAAGHAVTAFVRDPSSIEAAADVRIVTGDVLDPDATNAAIAGQDAVLSALGSRTLARTNLLDHASANIIASMDSHGIKRLIVLGAAGALHDANAQQSAGRKALFGLIRNTMLKNPLDDSAAQERRIEASDLDYTIVHPPRLLDEAASSTYRVALDGLPPESKSIARADVAAFMLRALTDGAYIRQGPYISN